MRRFGHVLSYRPCSTRPVLPSTPPGRSGGPGQCPGVGPPAATLPGLGFRLPAAVQPEILFGGPSHDAFQGRGVGLGHGSDGIFVDQLGVDQFLAADFESLGAVPVVQTNRVADADQGPVPQGQQRDRLEGRGGLSEEIDEQAVCAGVLVAEHRQVSVGFESLDHLAAGPILVEQVVAGVGAEVEKEPVEEGVVESAGDHAHRKSEHAEDPDRQFPVAHVATDQDHGSVRVSLLCLSRRGCIRASSTRFHRFLLKILKHFKKKIIKNNISITFRCL